MARQVTVYTTPSCTLCRRAVEDLERQHIESTLQAFKNNRARTAEALGISKKTLYLKLKRYGMGEPG